MLAILTAILDPVTGWADHADFGSSPWIPPATLNERPKGKDLRHPSIKTHHRCDQR
jgi:hypothetical protein